MENYGKVISKLRKANGYTQEELGKALNVTYQAVSKWENDLSRPDFDTITQMCRLFHISVDEFSRLVNQTADGEEITIPTAEQPAEEKSETAATSMPDTVAPKAADEFVTQTPDSEPVPPVVPAETKPVKSLHVGFLIGLIAAIVVGLTSFLSIGILLQSDIGSASYAFGVVVGYLLFSFVVLLGHDAMPAELFLDCVFKSINVPGVIFTLDIDGILFLIFYKFIVAPLVSVVVWLFFVIGGFIISLFLAAFCFPFYIPRIYRETFCGGRTRPKKERKIRTRKAKA